MEHKPKVPSKANPGRGSLLDQLYKHAAYRWAILLVGLALLTWLWTFAGQVRRPGRLKHRPAVFASRLLVAAGGLFLVRLLLFSDEERVPVILLNSSGTSGDVVSKETRLGFVENLLRKGYQAVPLSDVVRFIQEGRYVPKRCFSLVLEIASLDELEAISASTGDLSPTFLFPPRAIERPSGAPERFDLPESAALGITLRGRPDVLADHGVRLEQVLRSFADEIFGVLGTKPQYALVENHLGIDLRAILESTGYICILDGKGYNRFGDQPHLVRLMDISGLVGGGLLGGLLPIAYMEMFKGKCSWWPVAAIGRMLRGVHKRD